MQFTYKDEDSIDQSLLCSICTTPFIDPIFHADCGNIFCKKCLEKVKDCPLCRNPITNIIPPPKIIVGFLDKLKVICPSCQEIYERGILLDHISKCPIPCIFGCGEMIAPRERDSHTKLCIYQETECSALDVGCDWKGKRKDLENHHKVCQWITMRIPLLEIVKLRKDMVQLRNENEKLKMEMVQLKDSLGNENEKLKVEMVQMKEESQYLRKEVSGLKEMVKELKQHIPISKPTQESLATNPSLFQDPPLKPINQEKQPMKLNIDKQWNFVAPMQSDRCRHSSAVHGDFIYSIGGWNGTTILSSVERYNIKSNQWESFPSLKSARSYHSSVTCGDSIFSIGGWLSDYSTTNTVEKYDMKGSKEWYSVAPMITARCYLGAAAYREFIFVTGGYDSSNSTLSTVEKYNTQTNKWSAVSSMISKRNGHVSVTCGDSIYSIGGFDGKQYQNSAERYDIQSDKWISIAPMKQQRVFHAAVSIGESIFVLGGDGSSVENVEMYDVRSNQWMEITPLNTARQHLTASIYGNSIFAIGGCEDLLSNQPLKTVEKLQLF